MSEIFPLSILEHEEFLAWAKKQDWLADAVPEIQRKKMTGEKLLALEWDFIIPELKISIELRDRLWRLILEISELERENLLKMIGANPRDAKVGFSICMPSLSELFSSWLVNDDSQEGFRGRRIFYAKGGFFKSKLL